MKSAVEPGLLEPELRSSVAKPFGKRLRREQATMAAMIRCYCQDHHRANDGLCPACQGLLDYATVRLERCRFGENKPTCANCPVHCYQPKRREQIREVMRYAGPRMLWRHPWLALAHLLDGRRPAPEPGSQKDADREHLGSEIGAER